MLFAGNMVIIDPDAADIIYITQTYIYGDQGIEMWKTFHFEKGLAQS